MKRFLPLLLLCVALGCSSAERSRMGFGHMMTDYKVTLYSGGQAVRTWNTKGEVLSEEKSDGYYFVDKATGKRVEVSGSILIEEAP
jgi:hypothetical protein